MNYREITEILHSVRRNKRDMELSYEPIHKQDSYPWNAKVVMVSLWRSIHQMANEIHKPEVSLRERKRKNPALIYRTNIEGSVRVSQHTSFKKLT